MKLKQARWVGVMALVILPLFPGYSQETGAPAPTGDTPAAVTLSPATDEVVNLAESGSTEEVILAYIQKTPSPYNLSADAVVYLKDLGVSSAVITAMLTHDKSLPAQPYTYNQQLYPPTGQAPPQPVPEQPPVAPPAPQPIQTTPPPAYVTTAPAEVNYFYNDLSPYGTWVDLEGYGWCWQPRTLIINRAWRPYCDGGHWVNSDAGWFWASDYSWGWAPFHYGRWHLHPRNGWVWFPDTTWAPAWVVWRSEADHCGWAPLPYRATFDARLGFRFNGVGVRADFDFGLGANLFTFVALRDFNGRDLSHHRLPPTEVTRIYRQTTVINNYTVNNNHVIVNHGIPVDRVSAATHSPVRTVAIHDLPAGANRPTTKGGNSGVVYRHEIKAPAHFNTPVVAQKIDDRHPVIQHPPVAPHVAPTPGRDRKNVSGPVNPGPANNPPRNQRDIQSPLQQPRTPQQPAGEKFIPRPQTPTPSHGVDNKEAAHNAPTTTPTTSSRYSTPRNTPPVPSAPLRTVTTDQNPHVYYPKSYRQAATAHALPPEPLSGNPGHSSAAPPSTSGGQPANQRDSGSHGPPGGQGKQSPR